MRARIPVALALVLAASFAAVPIATAGASGGGSPATRMLVFVRPAPRGAAEGRARVAQDAVAALVGDLGRGVLARTSVPDTLTVALTAAQAREVRADPLVTAVLPDAVIPGPSSPGAGALAAAVPAASRARGAHVKVAAPCGTPAHPELDPEGLANVNALGRGTDGFDGRGVTVAFLADGLQANDPDLLRSAAYASAQSPAGTRVITTYADFSGDGVDAPTDGAEAFGDAASIAAQGRVVYDLSRYVSRAHPLPHGCDARIVGVAPGASLLALKIYAEKNTTTGSAFVQAINYAVAHGASVINESFGSNPFPDTAADIIRAADDAAVAAGVTVVASTGDAGPNGTLATPASDPNVIAVGATTTFRAYAQDTYGGINAPGGSGRYVDDNISALSSGGIAQDGKTVDLVAPGDLNWALCSANRHLYSGCEGMNLQLFGGTSESAPMTSGAAADVIEAYAATHGGARPSPALVKQVLMSTAQDIGAPADEQGAGLLDVGAAVALAKSLPGTRSPGSGGLLVDAGQEDLGGTPGTTVSATFHVTNDSRAVVHLSASTRALVAAGGIGGVMQLNPSDAKTPVFDVWSGAPEVVKELAFRVRPGTARVELRAAYQYFGQASLLHVALLEPDGALAGYSLPQGVGDYLDVEVARPVPGVWHAAFFTVRTGFHGDTGTQGPFPFSVEFFRFGALGSVTPSRATLAPGATAALTYRRQLGSAPGDQAAAVVLRAGAQVHTVAVTLRTDVVLGTRGGSFTGVVTGGNGRGGAPGQTNAYDLVVPGGERDLDVGVRLAADPAAGEVPGLQLIAELVDPEGQAVDYESNYTQNETQPLFTRAVELYAQAPAAGTWQLVLDWVQPGAGRDVAIPFRVLLAFDRVSASAPLPDSATTVVPAGGATYDLTVRNNGIAELLVAPDARLDTTATLGLTDLASEAATQPLPNAGNLYYVPPATTSMQVTVEGTTETTFDTNPLEGDPDLSPTTSAPYATGSLTASAAQVEYAPPGGVAPGMWGVTQAEIGPFPAKGEPSATETTTFDVTTQPFDPAVSASVPDTVESLALGGSIAPMALDPGQTATIPVTFTPTAAPGTVVTGTLYVTGFTAGSFFGASITLAPCFTNVLAAIPYEYKVG